MIWSPAQVSAAWRVECCSSSVVVVQVVCRKRLENDGIMDMLRQAGAKDGDEVRIKDIVFTMVD